MELDTSKRKTIIALASPNLFHGAVESAFSEFGRKLWRIDRLAGKAYLLLVSEKEPDLGSAAKQFGTSDGWRTLDYDPFIRKIQTGDRRLFRLTANPVIAKSAGSGARGSILAHVTTDWQEKWLLDRSAKNGFSIGPDDFSVVHNEWVRFKKGNDHGRIVTFCTVTFEGTLTVSDASLFHEALKNGIGREKAYGCGLLTVSRNKNEQ